MINDLPSFVKSQTVLNADDITFINATSDFEQLQTSTENTFTNASIWFRANGCLLIENKTH